MSPQYQPDDESFDIHPVIDDDPIDSNKLSQHQQQFTNYCSTLKQQFLIPSPLRKSRIRLLYRIGYISLILLFLFQLLITIWFLLAPLRLYIDFDVFFDRQHRVGTYTPHRQHDIGYDIINPLIEHDFPLINVHLQPSQPTYPSEFHPHTLPIYTPQVSSLSELDFKHQYLLPTIPIEIEKPLHSLHFKNPTPIPLPYNPLGYRYIMSRPITRPKTLEEMKESQPTQTYATTQVTCFSDWFPYDLIKEQDDEILDPLYKKEIGVIQTTNTPNQFLKGHGHIFINKRQYGPSIPIENFDSEIEPPHRIVINTTRINKDILAKYYGYDKYSDLPFHPRIPTKTTNTTWSHRCITPWREDDGGVMRPRHFNTPELGQTDMNLSYDRCGRLLLHYGAWNDYGPFQPERGIRVVDIRRFEQGELLFRPLSDLCLIRNIFQQPIHTLGKGVEGHQEKYIYNWLLMTNGQTLSDMNEMIKLKLEFTQAASLYDYRTNSLLLTNKNYLRLLSKLIPHNPPLIPPWRSIDRIKPTEPKVTSSIVTYLHETNTYITKLVPFSQISGPIEKFEQTTKTISFINTNDNNDISMVNKEMYIIQECILTYNSFRAENELTLPLTATNIQSTANLLLIHIRQEDWDNDPFLSLTPIEKRISWVYFGIGHDTTRISNKNDKNSKNDPINGNIKDNNINRPFLFMLDATTSELIGIRPFIPTLPSKCREKQYDINCQYGQGTNCNEQCDFISIHYLTSTQTPLSYSLLSNTSTPPPPPKSSHFNYNNNTFDRQFYNDTTIQFLTEDNQYIERLISNNDHLVDTKQFVSPTNIPPTSAIPTFINPISPHSISPSTSTTTSTTSSPTSSSPPSFSSNTTLQGLHFTLPTYYTLDSQIFAIINHDNKQSYMQELDLIAFWRQRHPCNIPLDIKTYPKSIPQHNNNQHNNNEHTPRTKPYTNPYLNQLKAQQPQSTSLLSTWFPSQLTMVTYDWSILDWFPIYLVPYGLAQAYEFPFLPAEFNFPRYVNRDEYYQRPIRIFQYIVLPILIIIIIYLYIIRYIDTNWIDGTLNNSKFKRNHHIITSDTYGNNNNENESFLSSDDEYDEYDDGNDANLDNLSNIDSL